MLRISFWWAMPTLQGTLSPGNLHRRFAAMTVAALVFGAVFEPGDQSGELLDRFFVGHAAFFFAGQFGFAEHAGLAVAAGSGDDGGGALGEQVDVLKRAVFFVEADRAGKVHHVARAVRRLRKGRCKPCPSRSRR